MSFTPRGLLNRLVIWPLGLLTGGVFGLGFVVWAYGRKERAEKAAAIVVLGARVYPGGVPSGALRSRVEKAAELYHRGVAPVLLLTGGVWRDSPAEAVVARALAVAHGVPESACVLETESRTTEENARNAAAMLRERGALPAVVVSDPFHLLRARQLFRRHGVAVQTSPAWGMWREDPWYERLYWVFREAFALLLRPRLWF